MCAARRPHQRRALPVSDHLVSREFDIRKCLQVVSDELARAGVTFVTLRASNILTRVILSVEFQCAVYIVLIPRLNKVLHKAVH